MSWTERRAGPYTVRGISVGGVYTSLQIPELNVLLDAGVPMRSLASTEDLFVSHSHSDHVSALGSVLGIRDLTGKGPPRIFLPREHAESVVAVLAAMGTLTHAEMKAAYVGMAPGDEVHLRQDLFVRAFRTEHTVPSLGFQFLRKVQKLRPEFQSLPGEEIGRRRREDPTGMFDLAEHLELAYATDTRVEVLDHNPSLYRSRVLILECTFIDERRTAEESRRFGHLHLDELVARAERFENEAVVLMHFSQLYQPAEVHAILAAKLPDDLAQRVVVFAPHEGQWFG